MSLNQIQSTGHCHPTLSCLLSCIETLVLLARPCHCIVTPSCHFYQQFLDHQTISVISIINIDVKVTIHLFPHKLMFTSPIIFQLLKLRLLSRSDLVSCLTAREPERAVRCFWSDPSWSTETTNQHHGITMWCTTALQTSPGRKSARLLISRANSETIYWSLKH